MMRSSPYEEHFAGSAGGPRGGELEQKYQYREVNKSSSVSSSTMRPYHAREDSQPFSYAPIMPHTSTPLRSAAARDDHAMIKSESHLKSPQLVRKTLRSPTPPTNTISNTYHYSYNGNGSNSSGNNNSRSNNTNTNNNEIDFDFSHSRGGGSGVGDASRGRAPNGGSWSSYGGLSPLPPRQRSKTPTRYELEDLLRERRERAYSDYPRLTMPARAGGQAPPQPPQRRHQLSSTSLTSLHQPLGGSGYANRSKYNYDIEFNLNFDQLDSELLPPPPRQFSGDSNNNNKNTIQAFESLSRRIREVDISGDFAAQQPQQPQQRHYSLDRRNYHTIGSSNPSAALYQPRERRPPFDVAASPAAAYGGSQQQLYHTHTQLQQQQQQQQQQAARTAAYGNGGGALYGGGNISHSTSTTTTTAVDGGGGGGDMSPIYAISTKQQQQQQRQQQLPANNGYNHNYNTTAYRNATTTTTTATTPPMANRGEPELSITDYPQQQQQQQQHWQQQQQQHYQLNATAVASTPSPTSSSAYAPTRASPSRPETPAFPVTPRQFNYNYTYNNNNGNGNSPRSEFAGNGGQGGGVGGAGADVASYASETIYQTLGEQQPRPSSNVSSEPQEVAAHLVKYAKDSSKFWYRATLSRDDAITLLLHAPPGSFVIRDSTTYRNAYGLVLRVAELPPYSASGKPDELVRHFLIEPTTRGVRLKGCANEPVFTSLSAFVYEHSINRLGLPCLLRFPSEDDALAAPLLSEPSAAQRQLLTQGAACNVLYLCACETESLTGVEAIRKAVRQMHEQQSPPIEVHFKVTQQGITLTDNTRKQFFRKHYAGDIISYCAIDPEGHLWTPPKDGDKQQLEKAAKGGSNAATSTASSVAGGGKTIFAFVARRSPSSKYNQCHVFCDLDGNRQPAAAICAFVNKTLPTEKQRSAAL